MSAGAAQMIAESTEGHHLNEMIWSSVGCLIVVFIAMSARFYVRIFMKRQFGWDDRFLLAACIGYFCQCAVQIAVITYWNKHQPPQWEALLDCINMVVANGVIFIANNIVFRISLALFFSTFTMEPWQKKFMFGMVGIYGVLQFIYMFMYLFQCGLPQNLLINEVAGTCNNWTWYGPWSYMASALNCIIDWSFAALPIYLISRMKMNHKDRIASCFLIAMGASGSIASVIRIAFTAGLKTESNLIPSVQIVVAITVELACGITAVCCATLRPLFMFFFGEQLRKRAESKPKKGKELRPTDMSLSFGVLSTVDEADKKAWEEKKDNVQVQEKIPE